MAARKRAPHAMIYTGAKAQIASIDLDAAADALVAADWRGCVSRWNLSDGALRWQIDVDTTRGQAVLLDGPRVFVTTAGGRVLALDRDTGEALAGVDGVATCNGHDALARCGDLLVCFGDAPDRAGCVTALDADTLGPRWTRDVGERCRGAGAATVYVSPNRYDGRAGLRAIDAHDGAIRWERPCAAVPVAVDEAHDRVALGESAWTAFRSLDGLTTEGPRVARGAWQPEPARFSPDGSQLAVHDGFSVAFVDVASGVVRPSRMRHTKNVGPVRWSPDGAIVYSGGWDRAVRAHPALP